MFFTQVVHSDMGCASYVIASSDTGEAVVVDPRWEIESYLEIAAQHGFDIVKILETHNHADHVSGHGRLAEATGAIIAIHKDASVEYPHEDLSDGDVIDIGDIRLHILHTPGHRPEHIAIAVEDTARGSDPWLVLTGDSLFVGDVARPDLAVDGHEGAELLFHSLHDKLLALPEFAAVYPAHVAGSLCGRVSSNVTATTLGFEKRYNPALAFHERDEFVRYMNESLPQRPPNMERIVAANRGPLRTSTTRPDEVTPQVLDERVKKGAIPLDVRPTEAYLEEHVPRSIHVAVSGSQFGTRVGFVIPVDAQIVLIASSPKEAEQAAEALRVVAYEGLVGYLVFDQWEAAGKPVASMGHVSVGDLRERVQDRAPVRVIDVREASEWDDGTIPGATLIPYREIASRANELPKDETVAVTCQSGGRSALAASLLERAGFDHVVNVDGGMNAWMQAGFQVARP